MAEVTFIRRNGKVIPIRKKKEKKDPINKGRVAGAKIVAAGAVGALGVGYSVSQVDKFEGFNIKRAILKPRRDFGAKSFVRSMKNQRLSKNLTKYKRFKEKSDLSKSFVKKAILSKRKAMLAVFGAGVIGEAFIGSAVDDLTRKTKYQKYSNEIGASAGAVFGAGMLLATSKYTRLGKKAKSFSDMFGSLSRRSRKQRTKFENLSSKYFDNLAKKHTGKGLFD